MVSTKLWRLPTRGALGNGLRVVAGAVSHRTARLSSPRGASGSNFARTRRHRHRSLSVKPVENQVGTRIEIKFGPAIPKDETALAWATRSQSRWPGRASYQGKSSPFWYAADEFHELLLRERRPCANGAGT